MSKVWVVESGAYSDRTIAGVFSTEEAAKVYALPFGYDVTEYELDVERTDAPPGMVSFRFALFTDVTGDRAEAYPHYGTPREVPPIELASDGGTPRLLGECWARDKEHAIKIAADRRAVYLATHPVRRIG